MVMKKQLVIMGTFAILVCVGLSGCNQISNIFLTDEDKLVGTWNSEGIWLDVPTVLVFSSNGALKIEVKIGTMNFSLSDGKWDINVGILTMELEDLIPQTNYTYHFSEDNKTLTITDIDGSDSYILRKQ
jgi:hypothetical protein